LQFLLVRALYLNCVKTATLYPLKFKPILVERVWGGNALACYGKPVLPGQKIGETWEISDRDDAQSVVVNGPLAGKTLRQVIERFGADVIIGGARPPGAPRFPLLVKLLDARDRLSLQVHPPASVANQLGGEPKTEMWYVLDAAPDAHLMAGLKRGTTRAQFESALCSDTPALGELIHCFRVRAGDSIFIPSGRIHAIDAGLIIIEIQQNSDTTYRVYDWGRVGRQLHIAESLASIDFNDFEPSPTPLPIECEDFRVEKLPVDGNLTAQCDGTSFQILAGIAGRLTVNGESLGVGEFALLPAALGECSLAGNGSLLRVRNSSRSEVLH
jgi:mannose-6-phosphate isomerase